jgi:hypothetical protein
MSEIYSTDWGKYKNCSFDKAILLESGFKSSYHTCEPLMTRKKKLEKLVRRCDSQLLKKHFKTPFPKRKVPFYRTVIYDIYKEDENIPTTEVENEIIELTKDILFIYSKKREEREYLEDLLNSIEAEIAHREEMREWEIEYWRGCD